ncbi:uncharacterized protein isoform X2 [Rhodnius prolixus]|uniref:uncharacterized protein isoform X2 n=1 Tax=Rhodnius prolixus TaxID=13249 RepID=UPI003D1878EE
MQENAQKTGLAGESKTCTGTVLVQTKTVNRFSVASTGSAAPHLRSTTPKGCKNNRFGKTTTVRQLHKIVKERSMSVIYGEKHLLRGVKNGDLNTILYHCLQGKD